jgi:hypothetical protein
MKSALESLTDAELSAELSLLSRDRSDGAHAALTLALRERYRRLRLGWSASEQIRGKSRRPMTGFLATLTPDQRAAALANTDVDV